MNVFHLGYHYSECCYDEWCSIECHDAKGSYAECHFSFIVVLNVVMLIVVAPKNYHGQTLQINMLRLKMTIFSDTCPSWISVNNATRDVIDALNRGCHSYDRNVIMAYFRGRQQLKKSFVTVWPSFATAGSVWKIRERWSEGA
jgi:hypothetical protein